ncbi:DUF1499 domain-containing protein [Vibrio sp. T187]|uniref:DUF1499 domain-containing protein n=1 Tax=Vibrio TaxID=662 RepID=UPI0010C9CBB7|nr:MULTISPECIES: DUF1499 domain-containing protein [Vibrio]MBW3697111.1 DUF1499 domain-containing protein [Vibrio sp. T187]
MKKTALSLLSIFALSACSQSDISITDRTEQPCGDKPNCVSTQDIRNDFQLTEFWLIEGVTLTQIEEAALELPGAETAAKQDNYLRIECTTKLMRFVDDLELKLADNQLVVRSESRLGHSDFGVNRERAEMLRSILAQKGLLLTK